MFAAWLMLGLDGVPAMVELLRVLVNILDPNEKAHTDSTRLVSMRTLNNAFELSGHHIGKFPSLSTIILDHGCKYLFQLARSDHPSVLQLALRTISTIFETMRPYLKLQQELFLSFTIDRLTPVAPSTLAMGANRGVLSPRPGTPVTPSLGSTDSKTSLISEPAAPTKSVVLPARGETRELLLDTLTQLSNHPSFMVDLYSNYDCDPNSENLFSKLIEFLAQVRLHTFAMGLLISSDRVYILPTFQEIRNHLYRILSIFVWICF
jgi:golgi-specific brefeldin A-resistance guanine nucleotide exchange factor 1